MNNSNSIYNYKNISKDAHKVFLALSADYGNIGDMAITIAQAKILEEIFPDRQLIELPMKDIYNCINIVKEIINDNDIITLIGGGNIGNVYLGFEKKRRFLIENFKNNKIISFPQSIDFLETSDGQEEFKNSINTYASNRKLTLFAREQKSFNIMKNNFKNDVFLIPDTVLYLKDKINSNITHHSRQNITLCLRNDKEKITDINFKEEIQQLLKSNGFNNIISHDTHIGEVTVSADERYTIFFNLLSEFTKAKIIITDRLHGMIFSVITNTPCIVFDNSNHKNLSTYETWFKDFPNIRFMHNYNTETFLKYINELYELADFDYKINFNEYFEILFKTLKAEN